jgi:hypothetical protein
MGPIWRHLLAKPILGWFLVLPLAWVRFGRLILRSCHAERETQRDSEEIE